MQMGSDDLLDAQNVADRFDGKLKPDNAINKEVSLLFISSGPQADSLPSAATRFSPRRRQGVFRKWRLDLCACHRNALGAAESAGESTAIPVASSSPHENPQTEPGGVQAASRS